jgi:hypothetical protein
MMGNLKLSSPLKETNRDISNTFKSDYVLEFLDLPVPHSENDLQKALITQMKTFILASYETQLPDKGLLQRKLRDIIKHNDKNAVKTMPV